jgi:hypothetical protein
MARAKLPFPEFVREKLRISDGYDRSAYFGFGDPRPAGRTHAEFTTKAAIVDVGLVDTIVTDRLASSDVEVMMRWYSGESPERIFLAIAETGTQFSATASGRDIERFLQNCDARLETAQRSSPV